MPLLGLRGGGANLSSQRGFSPAFTLAEMMVVMLILSIVLAAFAPVMTTRQKRDISSPWRYSDNQSDAYFGLGNEQRAMIGQKNRPLSGTADPDNRLTIQTSRDTQSHILFKNNGNVIGRLLLNNDTVVLGNDATTAGYAVSIGRSVSASNDYSTAIGYRAEATNDYATALGYNSEASGEGSLAVATGVAEGKGSIAIGSYTQAKALNSLAISAGSGAEVAKATDDGALALGNGRASAESSLVLAPNHYGGGASSHSESSGYCAIAIGGNSHSTSDYTIAIGTGSEVSYKNSIAIGTGATSENENYSKGEGGVAIGSSASAKDGGISIGESSSSNTTVSYYKNASISLGRDTNSYDGGVAIGEGAVAGGRFATGVAIGLGADARSTSSGELGGGVAIGKSSQALNGAVAIGFASLAKPQNAYANNAAVAIGMDVKAQDGSVAVGSRVQADYSGVAIGDGSMALGEKNVAIGINALNANTEGSINVAVGNSVLAANVGGSDNVAIGDEAMNKNTYGALNVAIGTRALYQVQGKKGDYLNGSSNIAIGSSAQNRNLTGYENVAIGNQALYDNESGDKNTAVGAYACQFVKGSYKTCLGYYSGPMGADENSNKTVYIGESGSTIILGGSASGYSDRRLKYINGENKDGLEKIKQLKVFNYTFKKDETKTPRVGIIAQDLMKVFPKAVIKNGDGFYITRTEDILYALVNAVKELDAKITMLIKQENDKDKKIKELESRLQRLEAKIK